MSRDGRLSGTLLPRAVLAEIVLVFLALSIQEIRSADFWWQLRTGEWIVGHHALPRHDEFTYTVPGHDWIEVRWLFFALTYLGWALGGPALLILAQTAIVAAAFLTIVRPFGSVVRTLPGQLILLLGILTASGRFIVRPEIASFLLVSLYLWILEGQRRGDDPRRVWALPLLQVLWNGLHTLFVLGPLLAWAFAIGEAPSRRKRGVLVACAVTAAGLVNAYGLRGALLPVLLFKEIHATSVVGRTIDELRSPFALESWSYDLWAGACLFLLSGFCFLLNRKKTSVSRLAIWAAFSYLAAQSMRNVALLGFVATWAALGNLDEARPELARIRGRLPRAAPVAGSAALVLVTLCLAWYVVTGRSQDRRFGLGIDPSYQAEAAVDFLLHSGASPQIFHSMSDGSYLDWAAHPRFPVFIDGRNEVFAEPFIAEYLAVAGGSRDWDVFADRYGINVAMMHREHLGRLVERVRKSGRFVLVHVDPRELVFVRDIPAHADLIRKFRVDPRSPWTPRGPEPEELPTGWRKRIGTVAHPWYSLGMARSFLLVGGIEPALAYLERAHERFPSERETIVTLAQVYRSLGRAQDADRILSGVKLSQDEASRMDEFLAGLFTLTDRPADSIEPLRRALAARPDDPSLRGQLARAYFESKDYPHAAEAYREALRVAPREPTYWTELGHALALGQDPEGAIQAYTTALRFDPTLYQIQYNIGILLGRRGDLAGAVERYRQALRVKPDYEPARQALEGATAAASGSGSR